MAVVKPSCESWVFKNDAFSKVKLCGNILEVTTMEKKPHPPAIVRIDKDTYLDENTGEIRTFTHHNTRSGNIREVKRSYSKMRDLINANVTDGRQMRLVTLTYRENMTDSTRLYKDFVRFWQKWKRYSVTHGIPPCEYIAIPEPQARGAWHMHVLFIWPYVAPSFIDFADVSALWGHGWADQRLGKNYKNADNLGAYLTAYFENIPIEELDPDTIASGVEIIEKTYYVDGEEVTKKFAKGLRFGLYPVGFQIFRHSRGCKKPVFQNTIYAEAKEKVGAATPTFSKCYDVVDDETGEAVNHIEKVWYNAKRRNKEI